MKNKSISSFLLLFSFILIFPNNAFADGDEEPPTECSGLTVSLTCLNDINLICPDPKDDQEWHDECVAKALVDCVEPGREPWQGGPLPSPNGDPDEVNYREDCVTSTGATWYYPKINTYMLQYNGCDISLRAYSKTTRACHHQFLPPVIETESISIVETWNTDTRDRKVQPGGPTTIIKTVANRPVPERNQSNHTIRHDMSRTITTYEVDSQVDTELNIIDERKDYLMTKVLPYCGPSSGYGSMPFAEMWFQSGLTTYKVHNLGGEEIVYSDEHDNRILIAVWDYYLILPGTPNSMCSAYYAKEFIIDENRFSDPLTYLSERPYWWEEVVAQWPQSPLGPDW